MTRPPALIRRTAPGARRLAAALLAAAALAAPAPARAETVDMLVPAAVIYPGQAPEERPIEARPFHVRAEHLAEYALDRAQLEGLVARRTLLPGKPIRLTDLKAAALVEAGKPVTLVYSEEGLTITGLGTSLQSAGLGEAVRARNVDSGVVVSGTVRADGAVVIGG